MKKVMMTTVNISEVEEKMDTEKYSVTNVITNKDQRLCFKGT